MKKKKDISFGAVLRKNVIYFLYRIQSWWVLMTFLMWKH